MKLDRRLEGRSAAVEEGLNHVKDFMEYISRNEPMMLGFLDFIEQEALQLVAEHEAQVEEAQAVLTAKEAALAEAQRRQTIVCQGADRIRAAINDGVADVSRFSAAMYEAAVLDGYPHLDTKTIPMPFFRIKASLPNGAA